VLVDRLGKLPPASGPLHHPPGQIRAIVFIVRFMNACRVWVRCSGGRVGSIVVAVTLRATQDPRCHNFDLSNRLASAKAGCQSQSGQQKDAVETVAPLSWLPPPKNSCMALNRM